MSRSSPAGPVSLALPDDLRARVLAEAQRRGLKLSPAIRALVAERLQELEVAEQLSRAEQWQRAQAWAAWTAAERGDNPESDWEAVEAEFDRDSSPRQARNSR